MYKPWIKEPQFLHCIYIRCYYKFYLSKTNDGIRLPKSAPKLLKTIL